MLHKNKCFTIHRLSETTLFIIFYNKQLTDDTILSNYYEFHIIHFACLLNAILLFENTAPNLSDCFTDIKFNFLYLATLFSFFSTTKIIDLSAHLILIDPFSNWQLVLPEPFLLLSHH